MMIMVGPIHLITIDKTYQIVISSQITEVPIDNETRQWFMSYECQRILMPDKFFPRKDFIEFHNDVIFLGT